MPRKWHVRFGGGPTEKCSDNTGQLAGGLPDTIFADAHWEPPSVYDHIEWLKTRLRFPLYVVDNGRSLREDVKALTNHSGGTRYVDIPVFLKGRDGETDGIGRRQWTDSYKIRPIRRRIRELPGLRKGRRVPANTAVELWLGISTDEAIRMKTSRDRWIENRCPLIEAGMSRRTVTAFFDDSGGPDPNSSRCSASGPSCCPPPWSGSAPPHGLRSLESTSTSMATSWATTTVRSRAPISTTCGESSGRVPDCASLRRSCLPTASTPSAGSMG